MNLGVSSSGRVSILHTSAAPLFVVPPLLCQPHAARENRRPDVLGCRLRGDLGRDTASPERTRRILLGRFFMLHSQREGLSAGSVGEILDRDPIWLQS